MSVPDVAEAHAALAKGFCCFGSELGEFLLRPLEDLRPTINDETRALRRRR
ncbi:MAG: hypothetical protein ACYCXN_10275 [Acidimicrobiales bacterium]